MSSSTPIDVGHVQLTIGGMTCASCAARIERRLNKLDGVTATVNYATEKADVRYPSTVSPDDAGAAGPRRGRERRARRRGLHPVAAPTAARLARAHGAGDPAGHGPGAAIHLMAVAIPHPRLPGDHLRRLALPPRRVDQ